nr:MAG TPA: hypothetical protein [Caudoviricetes sp.]
MIWNLGFCTLLTPVRVWFLLLSISRVLCI